MTLIGALNCQNAVVLMADRQETIADYAKWEERKIYFLEAQGQYRLLMTGAGDPDAINQTWQEIVGMPHRFIAGYGQWPQFPDLKQHVINVVAKITKKTVFPVPSSERVGMELIFAIQPMSNQDVHASRGGIDLFRTNRLSVNTISRYYFSGNPVLLARYLSDMYLSDVLYTEHEARALAAYIMWEAKEYDPTVGKHSDIITLTWPHGEMRHMTADDVEFWENHFRALKESMSLIPLLSCASEHVNKVYAGRLDGIIETIKGLTSEQENRFPTKPVPSGDQT